MSEPGSRMSRRSRKNGGGSGHDSTGMMRWLLTYADLITLLMVFFVVLYSMSQVDQVKYQQLALSLNQILHGQSGNSMLDVSVVAANPPQMMPHAADNSLMRQHEDVELFGLAREIVEWAEEEGIENQVALSLEGRGLVVGISDGILFDEASAVLRPEAREIIRKFVPLLMENDHQIEVIGSTDDQPLRSPIYPTAWELSTARATQVVRYLVSLGISPTRLIATGLGEWHPRYPNDSDENRAKNRRVDIVILRNSVSIYQHVESDR